MWLPFTLLPLHFAQTSPATTPHMLHRQPSTVTCSLVGVCHLTRPGFQSLQQGVDWYPTLRLRRVLLHFIDLYVVHAMTWEKGGDLGHDTIIDDMRRFLCFMTAPLPVSALIPCNDLSSASIISCKQVLQCCSREYRYVLC